MHILIVNNTQIPALKYGGIERMIWWLGRELVRLGHKVTYLVAAGSSCPFAYVLTYDPSVDMNQQVPDDVDVVHFLFQVHGFTKKPYICTLQTNPGPGELDFNTAFVSANHAARYGSSVFVHNPIDPADYKKPDLKRKRTHLHFLAKAAWKVKNVRGAIDIATRSHNKLVVLGGSRLNFKMGLRFTPNLNVRFKGMVGDAVKSDVMNSSKGLLFPVLWHEPFGIAIVESLYFGCPVFGTPYGSLPELVPASVGFLSNSRSALVEAVKNIGQFNNRQCHEYAVENFNIGRITQQYLQLYSRVMNHEQLNTQKPALIEQPPKYLPWNN